MVWGKIDDKFHHHPKTMRVLHEHGGGPDPSAIGLWTLGFSWSSGSGTDGFIPDYMLPVWCGKLADDLAQTLVRAGFWEIANHDGVDGYQMHDFADYNPLKIERDEKAAKLSRKNELHDDPALKAAVRERDQDRCRYCGTGVNFMSRRGPSAGTYDHVDPDGPNNLGNVVVACGPCNHEKGRRTPEQWGHPLLPPGSKGPDGPASGTPTPAGPSPLPGAPAADLDPGQVDQWSRAGAGPGNGSGTGSGTGVDRNRIGSGSDLDPGVGSVSYLPGAVLGGSR